MWISSVTLVGYGRMALHDVKSFTLTPHDPIQLILGTNGSGKSSLLFEIFPLPPDKDDFSKDGSKTTVLTHGGNNYVLRSAFTPTWKHSFRKNDEELNPGGTVTTQKELVYKEFGLNEEIRDLLLGYEKFHSMTALRRREWFTMMSDVDYTFALKSFANLKSIHSEKYHALNHTKKRLVTESAKLISEAEEAKLKEELDIIYKELKLFIEQSAPVDMPVSHYEELQRNGLAELNRISSQLVRMKLMAIYGTYPYGASESEFERDDHGELRRSGYDSVAEIEVAIDAYKTGVTALSTLINKEVEEHTKVAETVKLLTEAGKEDIVSLGLELKRLHDKKEYILEQRPFKFDLRESSVVIDTSFRAMQNDLIDVLTALPPDEAGEFSGAKLKEYQDLRLVLIADKITSEKTLAAYVARKQHADVHKENGFIACPQCSHKWIPGYSDEQYDQLLKLISDQEITDKALSLEVTNNENKIAVMMEYRTVWGEYLRCSKNWPIFNPFWNHLSIDGLVRKYPRKAIAELGQLEHEVMLLKEADETEQAIVQTTRLIEDLEKVGDANLVEQRMKLDKLDSEISGMTARLAKLQGQLNDHQYYRRQLIETAELGRRVEELKDNVEKTNASMIEMMRREALNLCVRQLQHNLANKQETLTKVNQQKNTIADLEKDLARLTIQEAAAKLAIKCLSPTEGLIADGMLGFIRNYVVRMNNWIKKVWTYPLTVRHMGVSTENGTELEYKFPISVKSQPRDDVKKGSAGMHEIIDLAFRIIAIKALGLEDIPLMLDEFGKTFDDAHRKTAIDTIKTILEMHTHGQLFMVSHYSDSYGAFTNAEVCVLCPDNIIVPDSYNKHVEMS